MDKVNSNAQEIEDLIREMNYLSSITQSISEIKPLEILLSEIMESCKTLMNAEASSLLRYNEKEDVLEFEVATGEKGSEVKKIICRMGEGVAGWVAQNREPLMIDDCYSDKRFNPDYDRQTNFKTRNMICVPMIHKEKLVGVIQVINKKNDSSFTERDFTIFKILASQCAVAIENSSLLQIQIQQEVINRELRTAREIQQNLLPSELPSFDDLDISAVLIPAKEIGGDYYNLIKISDSRTLFFTADVSGKSISAALIVSTIYAAVITYLDRLTGEFSLIDFVNCLNRILILSTTSEKFATGWFGLYDHSEKSLESINAGHNATYIINESGEVTELIEGGLFLGLVDMEYKSEKAILKKNDVVFYFTDGINEAMDGEKNLYGDDRLKDILKKTVKRNSGEIKEKLLSDLFEFVNGAEQSDDITFGVIKILK
ncbi:MAG: SpoIIE family protein phosphatase [Ignavibacteria bacterium]|nr:SpoIIE family protein phosphatase [Ignavibacteria bacterium]